MSNGKTNLTLQLNDTVSGQKTVVILSMHEAKQLYLALRELFGDYQRPDPELFITLPKIELNLKDLKQPTRGV